MREETSPEASARHAPRGRRRLHAPRILAASLALVAAAALVPVLARQGPVQLRIAAGLLGSALVLFSASMVWLGRDLALSWVRFGASLGFAPATRRPLHDLGTDRPPLVGLAGDHCARLRIVRPRARRARARLQAELDLIGVEPGWWLSYEKGALRASDARLERRLEPWLRNVEALRLQEGRLVASARFDGLDEPPARALLRNAALIADELRKPL